MNKLKAGWQQFNRVYKYLSTSRNNFFEENYSELRSNLLRLLTKSILKILKQQSFNLEKNII